MGKSSRHKSENTFRFQTFSERISSINIDVIHQIKHHDDTPEEISTYFWDTLQKCSELNCTEHFTSFRKEIVQKVKTITQLVHHEEAIVASLKKHLLVPESMALPALMDLVVALARDLQKDFYRHFRDFFDILVGLLSTYTQDVEVLEQTFTCLSYMFKFLWRYLIKDIESVYEYFSSLLSQQYKEYIRNFAAECFAFLMRKVKDHSGLFDFLFKTLIEHPEKSEGLGRLLFEMMKGVKNQFHSSSTKLFPVLLTKLGPGKDSLAGSMPWEEIETVFKMMLLSMLKHADKEHAVPMVDTFMAALNNSYKEFLSVKGKKNKTASGDTFVRFMRLAKFIVDFKGGSVIDKPDTLGQMLSEFLKDGSLPEIIWEPLLAISSSLLLKCHSRMEVFVTSKLVSTVFKSSFSPEVVYNFVRTLFNSPIFEKNVLPCLLPYCDHQITMDSESHDRTLLLVTELLLHKSPLIQNGGELGSSDTYMLDFGPKSKFPEFIVSMLEDVKEQTDRHTLIKFWIALVCAPHVRPLEADGLMEIFGDFVVAGLSAPELLDNDKCFIMTQVIVTMTIMKDDLDITRSISSDLVFKCLMNESTNIQFLRFVDIYLTHAAKCDLQELLTEEKFNIVFPTLQENLSSPSSMMRMLTLRILTTFNLPQPETEFEIQDVLTICLYAEESPATVQTYRDKLRYLQKLEYANVQQAIPLVALQQVPLRYLIGCLFINFKLLWQPVIELISSHALGMDKVVFWKVFGQHLTLASENCRKSTPEYTATKLSESGELNTLFVESMEDLSDSDLSPDFDLFRIQLWKCMHSFPEKCESKSKTIVPLFFDFLSHEYYTEDKDQAATQDILKRELDDSPSSPSQLTQIKEKKTNQRNIEGIVEEKMEQSPEKDSDVEDSPVRRYRTRRASKCESEDLINVEIKSGDKTNVKSKQTSNNNKEMRKLRQSAKRKSELQDTDDNDNVEGTKSENGKRKKSKVAIESKVNEKDERVGTKTTKNRRFTRSLGKVEEMEVDSSDDDDDEIDDENDINPNSTSIEAVQESDDDNNDDNNDDDVKTQDDSILENVQDARKYQSASFKKGNVSSKGTGKKAVTSTLLVQLELFAKFGNLKAIHREAELREAYFEFLLHRHPGVQKAAFSCIAGYKDAYLMPYKENFNRLMEDATFKSELLAFSIDDSNSIIDPSHRQDVIPILMRILHGKMHSKTGMGPAGRRGMGTRQSLILRFLNGSREEELKIFIDLVFKSFLSFVSDNLYEKVKEIRRNLDLTKVLTLKRVQGAMSSIELILQKLGHLIDSYLPTMVQVIVGLGTLSAACLENRDKIVPFVHAPLKTIRQNTMSRITQIFIDYENYDWRPVEFDGIFEGLVWPQLDKLSVDGFDSPNPVLRFLLALTKNQRYFPLLAKHQEGNMELTPLVHVFKLLSHKDVSKSVTAVVLEMINNLLADTEDGDEDIPTVDVNHMVKLDRDCSVGVALLKPHVNEILIYLEKVVKTLFTKQNKRKENFIELDILSRISRFVTDRKLCKTLISLLLPFLHKKKSQKAEEDILLSIQNLLQMVEDRTVFIITVCRLFATLVQKNSRVLLSNVFRMMCEGNKELEYVAEIVQKLNSFDSKKVDEPDYIKRLDGYKEANSVVKGMTKMDRHMCVALVNNCCHIINTTEDMSLRDASTNCLVTIVTQFGKVEYNDYAYGTVIVECLLQEVKSGLHQRLEVVRHEYVVVLVALMDTFGDIQPYTDLKMLRDSDVEVDFYENIRHIQMHKRSRGMLQLIKHLGNHVFSSNTLLTFFVPLVTSLLTDYYRKHNALQDTAIKTYGVICQQLPWKHYYHQLEHYIQLLPKRPDNQKLIVRVIVSLLDAFHFDLSSSTFDMKLTPGIENEADKKKDKEDVIDDIPEVDIALESDDEDRDVEIPTLNEVVELKPLWGKRRVQVCSEKVATKIHCIISKKVIFQLRKILVQKVETDSQHKVNKSKYAEDDEILRVPISLAMVKLLQHLPTGALERFLPGVLLKVCNFLKSKSIDIRKTARDTLIKIQKSLGTRYFPFMLSELRGTLTSGYQRHILCFTIHMLLVQMTELIQPGDIDVCLKSLQEVLNEEIFGEMSDEKEVKGITVKLMEAKSSKSFDSYKLIAAHVTKHALMKLIQPLKQILDGTHSRKITIKVQTVLKTIVLGLVENKNLTIEHLLVFVHGLVSQTLPILKETKEAPTEEKKSDSLLEKKAEHSLLLPSQTPRGGLKPKASKKTNLHVLVEFGLELLNSCMKRQKINLRDSEHLQMLDPLVAQFKDCLYSKYAKVNAYTLRNLCWLMKSDLPSLKKNINQIADGMFILLRNNASPGTSKGDNMELLAMLFKAVTVLVREVKYYRIPEERLVVLLTFCEEDLHDLNRQSTAFSLLKAVMSRKIRLTQIDEMIDKLEEMSISAEAPHVRRECRQVVIHYLLDYPLGKKIIKHIEFYISQLSYEMESGRESALEMMATFFTSFPQNVLSDYGSLFFIPMSANLVNDESAKCRKLTALAIKSLLTNIDHNNRTNLFLFVMKWFMDSQLRNRSLAAQLCGQFVEVEGQKFEGRLSELLPVLEQQLEPGKYTGKSETKEHDQDHMIYNTLNTLLKVITECNFVVSDKKWTSTMNVIWEYVHHYLTYPHLWVQLVSCQLFGVLFTAYPPDTIFTWKKGKEDPPYLMIDSLKKMQRLAQDFTTQLQSELLNEDLANQVVKNMVYLGKCARQVYTEPKDDSDSEGEEEKETTNNIFTLPWLVRKMVREAHYEAIHNKRTIIKRSSVFKWMAAVSLDLGETILTSVLRRMLPPLQREIEDESKIQDPAIKSLAQEVTELLKKTVGVETFLHIYANTQRERNERKEGRKNKRAVQAVIDPEMAARRKINKHLAKRDAKKRKIEEKRPSMSKKSKKAKYEKFNIDQD